MSQEHRASNFEICENCKGEGMTNASELERRTGQMVKKECKICGGTGLVSTDVCYLCAGKGALKDGETCPNCRGSGKEI